MATDLGLREKKIKSPGDQLAISWLIHDEGRVDSYCNNAMVPLSETASGPLGTNVQIGSKYYFRTSSLGPHVHQQRIEATVSRTRRPPTELAPAAFPESSGGHSSNS
jgi:hypothetical protein